MNEPKYIKDRDVHAAYLMLDNTRIVHRTEVPLVTESSATVALDYDEDGNLLGIEVMW